MKKSSIATLIMLFLLIPAALYFGDRLPGKGYYLTGTLMTVFALVPFFLSFEHRKPQARELTVIAVLCAIAVALPACLCLDTEFQAHFCGHYDRRVCLRAGVRLFGGGGKRFCQ